MWRSFGKSFGKPPVWKSMRRGVVNPAVLNISEKLQKNRPAVASGPFTRPALSGRSTSTIVLHTAHVLTYGRAARLLRRADEAMIIVSADHKPSGDNVIVVDALGERGVGM